jgi:hypothetical protein
MGEMTVDGPGRALYVDDDSFEVRLQARFVPARNRDPFTRSARPTCRCRDCRGQSTFVAVLTACPPNGVSRFHDNRGAPTIREAACGRFIHAASLIQPAAVPQRHGKMKWFLAERILYAEFVSGLDFVQT